MREGWQITKLGAISEIFRGGSPRPIKSFITQEADGVNWIKIGDTEVGGKYIYSTEEKIRREGMRSSRYVEPGDFLLSNSMSFGRPYILKTDGCIHDGWLVIKKYDRTLIQDFLYYLLLSPVVARQFEEGARGSTVRNLNTDIVSNVVVSYPVSHIEQQRIVNILDREFAKIDALKANAEKSLQAAKDLYAEMLDTSLSSQNGWKTKTLDEVCSKITDGTHHSPPNTPSGEYKYITAKNIKPWGLDLTDLTFVSKDIHKEIYSRCNPNKGDVLYIKDGATTGIAIVNPLEEEFSLLSSVALLKPIPAEITSHYLCYAMNSPRMYAFVRERMDGAAITRITLKKIKAFPVSYPAIDEQNAIVSRLDDLKDRCNTLQQNYQKTLTLCDDLKQSLLRKAFNGEL